MKEETINKLIEAKDIPNIVNRYIKKTDKLYTDLLEISPDSEEHVKKFEKLINRDIIDSTALGTWITLLKHLTDSTSKKKLLGKCSCLLDNYESQLTNRKDIFGKMSDFLSCDYDTDDEFTITLKRLIRGYKRKGIMLDDDIFEKFQSLKSHMKHMENKILTEMYGVSKVASTKKSNLKGVPLEIIDTLTLIDKERVGIPLESDFVFKILTYLDNEDLRKKIEFNYNNKVIKEIINFGRIIVARHILSNILGYHNFSHYQMEKNMFKNPEDARNELLYLIEKSKIRFDSEINSLLKIKNKLNPENSDKLYSWDIPYYTQKWKEEYGLNNNIIKNYFEAKSSMKKIVKLAEDFFDVKLVPIKRNTWNFSVITYQMLDNDEPVGQILIDLFHRNTKTNLSTAFLIQPKEDNKQGYAVVVENWVITKKDNSFLINYNDLVNFGYHLAHCIGFLLNKPKDAFSGINGCEEEATNLVPLIFQYYLWEPSVIRKLSSHYRTGKKMDEILIQKLKKTKQIDIGFQLRNKVLVSIYDQYIHSDDQFIKLMKESLEGNNFEKKLTKIRLNLIEVHKMIFEELFNGTHHQVIFNDGCFQPYNWIEMFQGREGKVYTDLISEIIAADIYYYYFKKDLSDKTKNKKFKKEVVERIGKRKLEFIVEDLLGRSFSSDGMIALYDIDPDLENSYFIKTDNLHEDSDSGNNFTEIGSETDRTTKIKMPISKKFEEVGGIFAKK